MAKNLCRACGRDFYRLDLFDAHRRKIRARDSGTPTERLEGSCIAPEALHYTLINGIYYDDQGVRSWQKMDTARASRTT